MRLHTLFEFSPVDLLDYVVGRGEDGTVRWEPLLQTLHQKLKVTPWITVRSYIVHPNSFVVVNKPDEPLIGFITALLYLKPYRKYFAIVDFGAKTVKTISTSRLNSLTDAVITAHDKLNFVGKTVEQIEEMLRDDDGYLDATDAHFDEVVGFSRDLELPHSVMFGNKNLAAIRKIYEHIAFHEKAIALAARAKFLGK